MALAVIAFAVTTILRYAYVSNVGTEGNKADTSIPTVVTRIEPTEAFNHGVAITSDAQKGFPALHLNDGTDEAWGSGEGNADVYAGIALPVPRAVDKIRIRLFSPGGRAHLRMIRIVAADVNEKPGPGTATRTTWRAIRARIENSPDPWSNVLTILPLPDNTEVTIVIDHSDPEWRPRNTWAIACLRSEGDSPNYAVGGTGVYLRELELR